MAYGLHHNKEEEGILVFDLGGGTYDVSLLEGFEGIFEVLATGGNSRLGGDDWDKAIADWCLQQCTANLRMEIRWPTHFAHIERHQQVTRVLHHHLSSVDMPWRWSESSRLSRIACLRTGNGCRFFWCGPSCCGHF